MGFLFGYGSGLEEDGLATGKAKKCPGDTFLARGRVHGRQTAPGMGVDCRPFLIRNSENGQIRRTDK